MSKMLTAKSTDDIQFILGNPTKLGGYESTLYSDEYDNLFKIFDLTRVEYRMLPKKHQIVLALHFAEVSGIIPEIHELVYTPSGEFIGYSMDFIPGKKFDELCKSISFGDLLFLFKDLETKMKVLNNHNFCIGDFNPENILVHSNNELCIVDFDSFCFKEDTSEDILCDYKYLCPYSKVMNEKYNLYQFYSLFIDIIFNVNKYDNKKKEIIQKIECHELIPVEMKQKLFHFVNMRNKKGLDKLEYLF